MITIKQMPSGKKVEVPWCQGVTTRTVVESAQLRIPKGSSAFVNGQMIMLYGESNEQTIQQAEKEVQEARIRAFRAQERLKLAQLRLTQLKSQPSLGHIDSPLTDNAEIVIADN